MAITQSGSLASSASGDPTLTEPTSESVGADGTVAVAGQYSDSFAQSNPGMLYLDIGDSSGLLSASDASGNAVAGSGSHSIALSTSYADVNAILASLQYAATTSSGTDNISFDVWNQAGVETTGTVPVMINTGGGGGTDSWTGAVSSDWNNPANWSTGAVPVSGDTVQIYGKHTDDPTLSNAVLTGETIDIEGSGNGTPLVTLNNVTLNSLVEGGNGARVSIGGTLTIGAQGTLLTSGNTFVLSGTAETIVNNGLIASQPNGEMTIYNSQINNTAAATLDNHGSIAADGGSIALSSDATLPSAPPVWDVVNSGGVTISNGGGFSVNGTVSGGTLAFDGAGTLEFQQAQPLTNGAAISGFGQGDAINLLGGAGWGTISAFNNGTLEVVTNSGTEGIPLTGSYTLGNFEDQAVSYPNNPSTIVYAADGRPSGQLNTEIIAPASTTVAQGNTLGLGYVYIHGSNNGTVDNSGTVTLTVTAGSGTLYSPDATGTGTHQLTFSNQSISQIDNELLISSYVPAAGATSDSVQFAVNTGGAGFVTVLRSLPINVTATPQPTLTEPPSETVASGSSVVVSGSYTDNFAASNPGSMYLSISDSSGTLSSHYYTGSGGTVAAPGSGSNSIVFNGSYQDLGEIVNYLTYVGGAGGSDTINFDIWNQAGVETTGSVAVTVTSAGGSNGPSLVEPATATVAPGDNVAVAGQYADSFAQNNPGQLYLGISDSSGMLTATDASGATVAGSGGNSIGLSTDFVDLKAILSSLQYTASGTAGSDTIQFQVWNQAGAETTASTAITIGSQGIASAINQASSVMPTNSAMSQASGSSGTTPDTAPVVGASSATLNNVGQQPIGVPLTLNG